MALGLNPHSVPQLRVLLVLLTGLCGFHPCDCRENGRISQVPDAITDALLVGPLLSRLAPIASSRNAE